jgi:hypothetical protein
MEFQIGELVKLEDGRNGYFLENGSGDSVEVLVLGLIVTVSRKLLKLDI